MLLTGEADDRAAAQWERSTYIFLRTRDSKFTLLSFTLKMATAMYAEMLVNNQHCKRRATKSKSYTRTVYVVNVRISPCDSL